jgi:hypothetical protein
MFRGLAAHRGLKPLRFLFQPNPAQLADKFPNIMWLHYRSSLGDVCVVHKISSSQFAPRPTWNYWPCLRLPGLAGDFVILWVIL